MSHQRLAKFLPPIICIVQISLTSMLLSSQRIPRLGSLLAEDYVAPFSINSFASLILVAKYGLPPRSGWFSSIICRCFLRIISRVAPRSLYQKNSPVSIVFICPNHTRQPLCCNSWEGEGKTYEVSRINAASRLVICFSNPPL